MLNKKFDEDMQNGSFKDFKLAYDVKRSNLTSEVFFEKVAQSNEKLCCKGLMRIS